MLHLIPADCVPTLSSRYGLCVSMILGDAVEPLMPDRSKVRFQTKLDTGFTPRTEGEGSLPGCVCSSDVPVQANQQRRNSGRGPHLFRKGQAGLSHTGRARYQANYLPGPRDPFKRNTIEAIEGAGGGFSQ